MLVLIMSEVKIAIDRGNGITVFEYKKIFDLVNDFDSPIYERGVSKSGRARCRVCGEKIKKGEWEILFYHSFADAQYNSWTAVECHAHETCMPWKRFCEGEHKFDVVPSHFSLVHLGTK